MTTQAVELELQAFDTIEPASAALRRNLQETGERWEAAREVVALMGDRGRFIHNLNVRWPKTEAKDVILVAKMVCEEGPFVAFHSGPVWPHLIPGFTDRVRSGTVNWLVDEYPPENWVELLQVLNNLPRIRR